MVIHYGVLNHSHFFSCKQFVFQRFPLFDDRGMWRWEGRESERGRERRERGCERGERGREKDGRDRKKRGGEKGEKGEEGGGRRKKKRREEVKGGGIRDKDPPLYPLQEGLPLKCCLFMADFTASCNHGTKHY